MESAIEMFSASRKNCTLCTNSQKRIPVLFYVEGCIDKPYFAKPLHTFHQWKRIGGVESNVPRCTAYVKLH